jgi:hypothetical protein
MATGILSKTLRAALLAMVLTPAPLLAEPATSARQMLALAQAQAQDLALKGEADKIAARTGAATEIPAAVSLGASNAREPAVVPQVTAPTVEANAEWRNQSSLGASRDSNLPVAKTGAETPQILASAPAFEVADTPVAASRTSAAILSPVILPPSVQTGTAQEVPPPVAVQLPTSAASIATAASGGAAAVAAIPVAPPAPVPSAALASTDKATTQVKPIPAKADGNIAKDGRFDRNVVARPAADNARTSTRSTKLSPVTPQRRHRENDAVEFRYSDGVHRQLQQIANRPEVRSLLAQYGLK